MWNDDDFYSEPSEFNEQADEFKKSLRASVKEEILAEMDRLRKENEKLMDIRDHWNEKVRELENEYEAKMREIEKKLREAERIADSAKRMALFDLIRSYPDRAYTVKVKYVQRPKCDKCNERRELPYVTPRGFTRYERCECGESKPVYFVKAIPLVEIACYRNGESCAKYLYNDEADAECLRFVSVFFDSTPFDQIDMHQNTPIFRSEDLAKQYVEWLNNQENNK